MYFDKISKEQWRKDYVWNDNPYIIDKIYNNIKLPKRATKGSAGYDFFMYEDITISPHSEVNIPTGIRWVCGDMDKVLQLYPRSGMGFKHGVHLKNTVGIVDSDFAFADNEGHIHIKLCNPSNEPISIPQGKGYAQGIITKYYTTDDEDTITTERHGGFGSTDEE